MRLFIIVIKWKPSGNRVNSCLSLGLYSWPFQLYFSSFSFIFLNCSLAKVLNLAMMFYSKNLISILKLAPFCLFFWSKLNVTQTINEKLPNQPKSRILFENKSPPKDFILEGLWVPTSNLTCVHSCQQLASMHLAQECRPPRRPNIAGSFHHSLQQHRWGCRGRQPRRCFAYCQ